MRFLLLIVLTMMRYFVWINCYPVSINPETNAVHKPRLDIYKRQNSEFNRLITNNDDLSAYYGFNDQQPIRETANNNNQLTVNRVDGSRHRQSESDNYDYSQNEILDQAESRRRKILKKRPCVPVYENALGRRRNERFRNSGRTLYDLNFYFLGYQPNRYQVVPISSQQGTAEEFTEGQSDHQYNHYGGYDCTPNPFFRPPKPFGSGGSNGAYSDSQVADRPNFLGLFGQGLYDFLNGFLGYGNPDAGGGTSGPTSGAFADQQTGGNNERPVYEVNVPDTIQALNPNNWRPGQVVGGIQNSVNGFVQELSRYIPF